MVRPSNHFAAPTWSALVARPASVGATVEARLEALIESGELPPGSRLPSERSLAEMLGVSRSSVREAVRELWLKRLVDRRQGQGTFVTGVGPAREFLGLIHSRLDDTERALLDVMDYRATIEPAIAARAAERARPADIDTLRQLLAEMEAERSPRRAAELDAAFHHAIARATSNPLLLQLVEFSAEWLGATRHEALQGRRRRQQSQASHRAVLEAIARGDATAAAAAMEDHIREVTTFVEAQLRGEAKR